MPKLPTVLCRIICEYIAAYVLLDWIKPHQNKIRWDWLSANPNAIHSLENILFSEGLEETQDKIWWDYLFDNPAIFKKYVDPEIYDILMSL